MKKLMLLILSLGMCVQAETIVFTADSGDWYHKASFALDMAQTRAKNRASKLCRESGGRTLYNEYEFGTYKCEKKQKNGKTKLKCEATVSVQCATEGEVTLKCAKGKKKLFKIEGFLGSKKNVLKIKDTKAGTTYTINMRGMSDKQIYNLLCSESKDPTYTEKFFQKLKGHIRSSNNKKSDDNKKTQKEEKYYNNKIRSSGGKRG